jgi:hypothetical protein
MFVTILTNLYSYYQILAFKKLTVKDMGIWERGNVERGAEIYKVIFFLFGIKS